MKRIILSASVLAGLAALSSAASLALCYTATPNGNLYDYTMTLSVDTSQSAWSAGMGWTWITFGDVNSGTSTLADFTLTSAPPSPFNQLSFSSGGHNGPTWLFDANGIVYWTPTSANDTLTWTGTSANPGAPDTLQFSELMVTGGASADNFKDMEVCPVPEPASLLVLGGLLPIVLRRRRK